MNTFVILIPILISSLTFLHGVIVARGTARKDEVSVVRDVYETLAQEVERLRIRSEECDQDRVRLAAQIETLKKQMSASEDKSH
jgi:hypothetical protein